MGQPVKTGYIFGYRNDNGHPGKYGEKIDQVEGYLAGEVTHCALNREVCRYARFVTTVNFNVTESHN